ncbi:hypothetical protein MTO96_012038 [Rhipicephalus appendiculatus]
MEWHWTTEDTSEGNQILSQTLDAVPNSSLTKYIWKYVSAPTSKKRYRLSFAFGNVRHAPCLPWPREAVLLLVIAYLWRSQKAAHRVAHREMRWKSLIHGYGWVHAHTTW